MNRPTEQKYVGTETAKPASAHLIQVYIENANNRNAGGFTTPLPTKTEELQPFLEQLEISGPKDVSVEEIRLGRTGLGKVLCEALSNSPDPLNELNYLAAKINNIPTADYEAFIAALEARRHCGSLAEIINLTENLKCLDIQPVFEPSDYGEFLLETAKEDTSAVFDRLEHSKYSDERDLANYVLELETHVDKAAYGRAVADREKGVFTEYGYLTEGAGFREVYFGTEDIPPEYRVAEFPEPDQYLKTETADLAAFLLKIHALAGDYMDDVNHNINMLLDKKSSEYLMLITNEGIMLTEAAHAYRQGNPAFDVWTETVPCADVRAFVISISDQLGAIKGSVAEIDFSERRRDIAENSIKYTGVHAKFKYGEEKSLTVAEWDNLSAIQRGRLENRRMQYHPGDLRRLTQHLEALRQEQKTAGKVVEPHIMLIEINRGFTERSMIKQPDLLHITQPAARDLLARGEAAVYRLLPDGAKKLSPLDAMPNRTAVVEKYYSEMAISKNDLAGLNKWAVEKVGAMEAKRQTERDAMKKQKSQGQERQGQEH